MSAIGLIIGLIAALLLTRIPELAAVAGQLAKYVILSIGGANAPFL